MFAANQSLGLIEVTLLELVRVSLSRSLDEPNAGRGDAEKPSVQRPACAGARGRAEPDVLVWPSAALEGITNLHVLPSMQPNFPSIGDQLSPVTTTGKFSQSSSPHANGSVLEFACG